MLAPRRLPPEYQAWNRRWGAPSGKRVSLLPILRRPDVRWLLPRVTGPFGFQVNSTTRRFEYPWAFHVAPVTTGNRVVEIGGSLAGLQFVLARSGARVVNIDPGEAASTHGWPVGTARIARLNRAFGTDVQVIEATLQQARLPTDSIDTVYSISTIEHIPVTELQSLMKDIARILRPGGLCVLTLDLFLNLWPFSDLASNEWGTNVSVKSVVDFSGLSLVVGRRSELFGYAEFRLREILAHIEDFLIGSAYPVLTQCLVLRKHAD